MGTLYIGMTRDLVKRVWEHKIKAVPGFAARYGVDRLVGLSSMLRSNLLLRENARSKNGSVFGKFS